MTSRPSELSARLLEAFEHRDWVLFERLCHPEAVLPTLVANGVPLTGPELVSVLRDAADDFVYDLEMRSLVDVDDRVCLASGRIRHRLPSGGIADHEMFWLYVFKDGLFWRCGVYSSRQKARDAYRAGGYSLGIEALQAPAVDEVAAVVPDPTPSNAFR